MSEVHSEAATPRDDLIDPFGRTIEYVRLSVTDKCNLRCFYCLPEGHKDFEEAGNRLSFDEIETVMAAFGELGVRRVRITGGEPLLRKDLPTLVGRLAALPGIEDGDHTVILHSDAEASGVLEGIPSVFDLAEQYDDTDAKLRVLQGWEGLSAVGRPVAAPPGVPEDRLAFLRQAFEQAISDPEFVAKAEAAGRDLSYRSGERTGELAKAATDLDERTRKLFVAAIKGEL